RGDVLAVADADAADHLVAHAAPGDLVDEGVGLGDGPHGVGGAEALGDLVLLDHRLDGDDVAGAGHAGALDGGAADAADADDGDVVAGADLGGVDRRAPAGADAAAEQARQLQRDVVLDLHAGHLVDHRVPPEGAEA